MVPDDDEYVRILAKQVASLTIRSNWEGEQDDRTDRAARCLEGYLATDWEGCVDCDEVRDCIETDEGVQDAIIEILNANQPFPVEFPTGQMLPESRLTQDLSTPYNPTCNLDILFGQCYGVVDLIDASIVDVNQKLETATNVGELAGSILSTIPILAGLVKVIGVDGALGMFNYFQEVVQEGYDAQYTTTPGGTRDQIACALFCACKVDCTITIDRLTTVLADRLAVYQSPPSLTGFIDLVETLAGINVDTTYVVDSAFYAAVGLMVTGNYLFGGVADNVIDLVIALAADEPSNDWMLLCTDCDEGEYLIFTRAIAQGGTLDDTGVFESGVPFTVNALPRGGGSTYEVAIYANGDYTMTYDIAPDPVNAAVTGEICWLYTDLDDDAIFATSPTEVASDMPTGVDVRLTEGSDFGCLFFNAQEPFTVEITLTAL